MARATRSSATKPSPSPLVKREPVQLSSPPPTPIPQRTRKRKTVKDEDASGAESPDKTPPLAKRTKRAKTATVKKEENDINDLPHNLGAIPDVSPTAIKSDGTSSAKKSTKAKKPTKTKAANKEGVKDVVAKATATTKESSKKKAKNNTYGLTPGHTPYPNWPHPTAEECEEVTRILSKVHGQAQAPETIPEPSLQVSGCGEVPSVLDALIRTRLSAATSGANSSRAFAGLVARFGILKSGIGKGSVDWNAVRLADTKDVFEAIKSGGLADVKSKDIKKILQMVWEENQARREQLLSSDANPPGSTNQAPKEKDAEVDKADQNIVSLDHLHQLSTDDAFNALTKYPGIGPKTASCVLLLCLQRPSFAVDTHVFRLCKWLGWVPPPGDPAGLAPNAKGPFAGPTRNSTYAHCEVRVPDHLKYPLHQLLIKHGKSCPRCRAITGESSEGWKKGCPIEHLVQRSGGRKDGGAAASVVKGGKKKKKRVEESEESEAESTGVESSEPELESGSELSDVESSALSDESE